MFFDLGFGMYLVMAKLRASLGLPETPLLASSAIALSSGRFADSHSKWADLYLLSGQNEGGGGMASVCVHYGPFVV